jgi:hypothetical protein
MTMITVLRQPIAYNSAVEKVLLNFVRTAKYVFQIITLEIKKIPRQLADFQLEGI